MSSSNDMRYRIFYDIILILSLIYAPWYFFMALGFAGLIFFSGFWELLVGALFIDLLFSTDTIRFFDFHFVLTLGAAMGLLAASVIRRTFRLR